MNALTLTTEELEIAEGQCQRCEFWQWWDGCSWNKQERTTFKKLDALPMADCILFCPTPDCGAFGEVK